MTYENAIRFINAQERAIRKVNDTRFTFKGFEYKIVYEGGFAAFVGIYRREVGKRNFKYFHGFSAAHCLTVGQVLDKAKEVICA